MNCAKCHDHKYDPISQTDFYRFRAFFEPYQVRTDQVPGELDLEKDGLPRAFDCNLEAPTFLFMRGDERRPEKDRPLSPGIPSWLSFGELAIRPVTLPLEAHAPGLRAFVLEDQLRNAEKRIAAARDVLTRAKTTLAEVAKNGGPTAAKSRAAVLIAEKALTAAEAQPLALRARAAADRVLLSPNPPPHARNLARVAAAAEKQVAVAVAEEALARAELDLLQADAGKKAEAEKKRNTARDVASSTRKALEAPGELYTPLRGSLKTLESNLETEASRSKPFPTISTGRRAALAQWITDRRNPLTARVAVNHVWTWHFGTPLVATVFDFGRKGAAPTHPELLDWLAVEFMDSGWSMKHLHRLIVTSEAYQLSSSPAGATVANRTTDPENRGYWRMNPIRMDAQLLRDSLLHLAGELNTTMGGPAIPVTEEASRRRSLYFVHSHNDQHKFLSMFDDASVLECYRRETSIVPQQALALSNSKFALAMTGRINGRLHERLGKLAEAEFVQAAFETILASSPTVAEQAACEQALTQLTDLLRKQGQRDAVHRARGDLIQALLNHNDFITIR